MPFTDTLVQRLAAARSVAVLTGAGVSAESGVPTFRDPDGLWARFCPEELANVRAFLKNPALVQSWYAHRRAVVEDVDPNPGHHAIADLERLVVGRGGRFLLATQNVDGLHVRAGTERIVELHGSLLRAYCLDCAAPQRIEQAEAQDPATCRACGGLVRPDVVWFGENLPPGAFDRAAEAASEADVFLSVGTSAVVYPAASLPLVASAHGAYTAEVNVEPSAIADSLDEVVLGPSGEVLPRLLDAVRNA